MAAEGLSIRTHKHRLPDSRAGLAHRYVYNRIGMAEGLGAEPHSSRGDEQYLLAHIAELGDLADDRLDPVAIDAGRRREDIRSGLYHYTPDTREIAHQIRSL